MITASHNPVPYNGIKLLPGNGMAPPQATAEQIRGTYFDKRFHRVGSTECGTVSRNRETDRIHIERVLAVVEPQRIAARGSRVVLDSIKGAGGGITRKLPARLGCKVVAINDATLNTSDGCRFDFADGWIHLCTNNIEPVMRVIVEARGESPARRYLDAVSEIRKSVREQTRARVQ